MQGLMKKLSRSRLKSNVITNPADTFSVPFARINFTNSSLSLSIEETFRLFDKNGDGAISVSELYEVMKTLGFKEKKKQVRKIVKLVDTNKNGAIDYDEFTSFMDNSKHRSLEPNSMNNIEAFVKRTFKMFDLNGDGYIHRSEIRKVMQQLGLYLTDDDITEMIAVADDNGDGLIDFEEFRRLLEQYT